MSVPPAFARGIKLAGEATIEVKVPMFGDVSLNLCATTGICARVYMTPEQVQTLIATLHLALEYV